MILIVCPETGWTKLFVDGKLLAQGFDGRETLLSALRLALESENPLYPRFQEISELFDKLTEEDYAESFI